MPGAKKTKVFEGTKNESRAVRHLDSDDESSDEEVMMNNG